MRIVNGRFDLSVCGHSGEAHRLHLSFARLRSVEPLIYETFPRICEVDINHGGSCFCAVRSWSDFIYCAGKKGISSSSHASTIISTSVGTRGRPRFRPRFVAASYISMSEETPPVRRMGCSASVPAVLV